MAKSKRGTSAASKGVSPGRVTPRNRAVRKPTEESARYTRPIPRRYKESPRWMGPVILALFVLGALTIIFNYFDVWGQSGWALLVGVGLIVSGLVVAVNYR